MSLKAFHIFFILCSILLNMGLAVWQFETYQALHSLKSLALSTGFFISALGLAGYGVWFLKKMKKMGML